MSPQSFAIGGGAMERTTRIEARRSARQRAQARADTVPGLLLRAGALRRRVAVATDPNADSRRELPRGHAPGHDVDRVLVVGTGSGHGWGVPSSDNALCNGLATALSRETHRGCEVELVAGPSVELTRMVSALAGRPLERYDAVILVVGLDEAIGRVAVARWQTRLSQVLKALLARTPVSTEIVVVGIPPIRSISAFDSALGGVAERHARRLDAATEALCDHTERTSYLEMRGDVDGYESGGAGLAVGDPRWLARVASIVSERLGLHYDLDGDRRRPQPSESELREHLTLNGVPLAETPIAHTEIADTLAEIVALSQRAFHTGMATVSMIDDRHGLPIVRIGSEPVASASESPWYELAAGGTVPLIVQDTLDDERFRDDPMVTGESHLRFFAAIPIDAPGGGRIGAICVFDGSPRRRADDIDQEQVRQLATFVQHDFSRILAAHRASHQG